MTVWQSFDNHASSVLYMCNLALDPYLFAQRQGKERPGGSLPLYRDGVLMDHSTLSLALSAANNLPPFSIVGALLGVAVLWPAVRVNYSPFLRGVFRYCSRTSGT